MPKARCTKEFSELCLKLINKNSKDFIIHHTVTGRFMTTNLTPEYELSTYFRVYNNKHGNYIEVGPDHDGLDLVRIEDSETKAQIICTKERAELLVRALERFIDGL